MGKRIAISVQRHWGLESELDSRFGRAPAFVIVDLATKQVLAELDNGFANDPQGAGTGAAAQMSGAKVDSVISGRFGPKAYEALNRLGIEMWLAPEGITAKEVLNQFESGTLSQMTLKVY